VMVLLSLLAMNTDNLTKTALHYGSLCGLSMFGFYALLHYSGFNIFGNISLTGIWIPLLFIIRALKTHRNVNLGGSMNYGQGFRMGITTSFFSALLFGLLFYLWGVFLETGLANEYKIYASQSLEQGRELLSDSFVEQALDSIEEATISSLAFSESLSKVFGGVLITLIAAGFLKRQNNRDIVD